jgi:uncharacterized membrane protein
MDCTIIMEPVMEIVKSQKEIVGVQTSLWVLADSVKTTRLHFTLPPIWVLGLLVVMFLKWLMHLLLEFFGALKSFILKIIIEKGKGKKKK